MDVVVVNALRSAIGNFGGALASSSASEIGTHIVTALLKTTPIAPAKINEVVIGQVLTAGCGQNPARQTALQARLPASVPAFTINQVCGSGLKAVQLAAQSIQCGESDVVIAGGQENMSMAPHVLPNSRNGARMGEWRMLDSMVHDGLWDAFNDYHMGCTAENLASHFAISREEQDAFAAASQQKAEAAQKSGRFNEEIVPIEIPQRKAEPLLFAVDEFPRHGTTAESLAKLKPAFTAAEGREPTVTAGNASGINDGAAMLLLMSEKKAQELKLEPLVRIKSCSTAGVDPAIMGTGPIQATRRCLRKIGWTLQSLDLVESNEAFAAQSIAVNKELEWDLDKVNVNGGAIALGHPIGASGARILVTLIHEMCKRDVNKGLATLCVGGGQGVAIAVER